MFFIWFKILDVAQIIVSLSSRHLWRDNCLEDSSEHQKCTYVLYCELVSQMCTVINTPT